MQTYTAYIIKRIAWPAILICFSLTAVAWFSQSLRFFDMIINRGLSIGVFAFLSSLLIPSLLYIVMPIALFISVLYVYSKLLSEQELVILKAVGVSNLSLAKPVLIFAVIVTIFSFIVGLYLQPLAFRSFKDKQIELRNNYAALLLEKGVFVSPGKGLTVYVRDIGDNGELYGLLVKDNRDDNKGATLMAEKGKIITANKDNNGVPWLVMLNGNRQEIDEERGGSILHFKEYLLELDIFSAKKEVRTWREPKEQYLHELFADEGEDAAELKAEGHYRLVWPFFNILLALLAVFPFLKGQFSRFPRVKQIMITIFGAITLVVVGFMLKNIIPKFPMVTSLLYVWVIGGIALCLWIIRD